MSKENSITRDVPSNHSMRMNLYDLGADLKGAGAELLTGTKGVLSVDHTDVGTAPGWDHLQTDTTRLNNTDLSSIRFRLSQTDGSYR